jgi:hypothetical protein
MDNNRVVDANHSSLNPFTTVTPIFNFITIPHRQPSPRKWFYEYSVVYRRDQGWLGRIGVATNTELDRSAIPFRDIPHFGMLWQMLL